MANVNNRKKKLKKQLNPFQILRIFNSSEKIIKEYDATGAKLVKITKEYQSKTIWDILQIILIPVVLAVIGFWFTAQQQQTSIQVSSKQHEADLYIAQDQQEETALNTYIADISDLILNKNLNDYNNSSYSAITSIARIKTLAVLNRVNSKRKGIILEFLDESRLINRDGYVIYLRDADFQSTNLPNNYEHVASVFLEDTNFSYSNLSKVVLIGSDLGDAKLDYVNFSGGYLRGTDLSDANISHSNFSNVNFSDQDGYNGPHNLHKGDRLS